MPIDPHAEQAGAALEPSFARQDLQRVLERLARARLERPLHEPKVRVGDLSRQDVVEPLPLHLLRGAVEQVLARGENLDVSPLVIDDEDEIGKRVEDGRQPVLASFEIRGAGQDAILELVGIALDALAELRLPNRDGQRAGDFLGDLDGRWIEAVLVERRHIQDADEVAIGQERHVNDGRRSGGERIREHALRAQAAQASHQTGLQIFPDTEGLDRNHRAVNRLLLSLVPRRDDRSRSLRQVEHGHAGAATGNQALDVPKRGRRDLLRRARPEDVQVNVVQHAQPAVVLPQRLTGALTLGDVALDAEVAGDAALGVVETEVVAFDLDRRAVEPALVGFDMEPAMVEELAPDAAAVREVVLKQIPRRGAEKRLACGAVLGQHRVVDLGHTLVLEHVVEGALLVDRVVPLDGLVDHHEEEAVQRLRKEELETVVGVHRRERGIVSPFYNDPWERMPAANDLRAILNEAEAGRRPRRPRVG